MTDDRHTQAAPLFEQTNARLMAALAELASDSVIVMGGFIASTVDGVTTTLGRGGSDYTAAIGSRTGAGRNSDPDGRRRNADGQTHYSADGYRVKTCSFAEAAELACSARRCLWWHPATVLPAIQKTFRFGF